MATGVIRGRQTFTNDGAYRNVSEAERTVNNAVNQAKHDYYVARAKQQTAQNLAKASNDTPTYRSTSSSSDTGSGGGGGGSYSGSSADDVINQIKALLSEQYAKSKEAYQAMLDQAKAQNLRTRDANRNQINVNFKRAERRLNDMYGDSISGQGLSNRARNYQNWQSNLANNEQNYATNEANALSQYNSNLANSASTLAQGWYNYILPFKVQDAQQARDYDYRKYLASL